MRPRYCAFLAFANGSDAHASGLARPRSFSVTMTLSLPCGRDHLCVAFLDLSAFGAADGSCKIDQLELRHQGQSAAVVELHTAWQPRWTPASGPGNSPRVWFLDPACDPQAGHLHMHILAEEVTARTSVPASARAAPRRAKAFQIKEENLAQEATSARCDPVDVIDTTCSEPQQQNGCQEQDHEQDNDGKDLVHVLGAVSGDLLCTVAMGPTAWTVCDLKKALSVTLGCAPQEQRLLLEGRLLHDEEEELGGMVVGDARVMASKPKATTVALVRNSAAWVTALDSVLRGGRLSELDAIYCRDKEVVLAAVTRSGTELSYAAIELRSNREVVLAAVWQDGKALCYASEELQADREVVLAAVQSHGQALWYAAAELRHDREVAVAAVHADGLALELLPPELCGDRAIVLTAVRSGGRALRFAPSEFHCDREVVLAAVSNDGAALQDVQGWLRHDREVVLAALAAGIPDCLIWLVPVELRSDREVQRAASRLGIGIAARTLGIVLEGHSPRASLEILLNGGRVA
eukprot:gnl/TRDRNA2_/TRDRNA2_134382_c0_seq1.p1 gnl/TRDRNA2_/TRDRNA2_134382_c0~~gnl/TRDRNA2_/TRDRNA2_134382_c0_seq1.p1  ORF type:complete len:521 (+),score=86.63 gnl/TRDRNA2_/TRDRNA2_134382_c0_seq1:126-1688(+)